MPNTDNLKPIRTTDEAREKGKKGGIMSGESRREKRKLRMILTELLETTAPHEEYSKENIAIALLKKASAGDVKAFETIAKFTGELPTKAQTERTDEEIKNDPFHIGI